MARGNYLRARRILEHSIRVGDAVLRRAPNDRDLRYAVAGGHGMLSNTLDKQGFTENALAEARWCVAMMAVLARQYPDDIDIIRNEASAHGILGLLYDRSENIAAALAEIELSIAGKRRVLPLNDTAEMRVDLAVPIHKAGLAMLKLGRFEQAQMTLEPERASLEVILARNPSYWPMRELLAIFDDDLVALALATGDLDSASRYAESHVARSQKLTSFDPENIDWSRHFALAHRSRGTVARMRGDIALALREHRTAIDIFAANFARGKQTRLLVRELAASRVELARSELAEAHADKALAQASLAVEALLPTRSEIPTQRPLADALLVQGQAREADRDPVGARAAWNDALQILEPLDRMSPDPRITDLHARVLLQLERIEDARQIIQSLVAMGYGNREFEALCRGKGAWSADVNRRVYGN
jgi:tetratricopeptide (TPR) repeat protein